MKVLQNLPDSTALPSFDQQSGFLNHYEVQGGVPQVGIIF